MYSLPIMTASASASAPGYVDALTNAFKDVSDQVLAMITATLPFAMSIVAGVMVITIGIGIFKKVTAKA